MNLMKLAESSDTDDDRGQLSHSEIQATIRKIEDIHGIEIDGEALTEMITANGNNLYGEFLSTERSYDSHPTSLIFSRPKLQRF